MALIGLKALYPEGIATRGMVEVCFKEASYWGHRCNSTGTPFVYWQEVYDKLSRQNPEYKQISVASGTASVSFNRFGNQRAADRYSFNTDNGEFTETNLYQHQDKSEKFVVGFTLYMLATGEEC